MIDLDRSLEIVETRVHVTAEGRGQLNPWMGPAFRGIVARTMKDMVCRHEPALRETRWRYCEGCTHLPVCGYGRIYEPPMMHVGATTRGKQQGPRRVVVSPMYPIVAQGESAIAFPIRVVLTGSTAPQDMATVLQAIEHASESKTLGHDKLRFVVDRIEPVTFTTLRDIDLPGEVKETDARLDRVVVQLHSPLYLEQKAEGGKRGKQAVVEPVFSDLLRVSMRTLSTLFQAEGKALAANFAQLKACSMQVETRQRDYRIFKQSRISYRTEQRWSNCGVVGWSEFANVPLPLIPWLVWAGRVHAGAHRVAGAGSWRVSLG